MDAAPVGVFTIEGCLHQRRLGDGASHHVGHVLVARARDVERNELGGAFAVARHLLRQALAYARQYLLELLELFGRFDVRTAGSIRQYEQCVIGARVAIDADAMEGVVGCVTQCLVQPGGVDRYVRHDHYSAWCPCWGESCQIPSRCR